MSSIISPISRPKLAFSMTYGEVRAIKYFCFGPFPPRLGRPALERTILFVRRQARRVQVQPVERALAHLLIPSQKSKGTTKYE